MGGNIKKNFCSGFVEYQFKDNIFIIFNVICKDVVVEFDVIGNVVIIVDDVDGDSYYLFGEFFDMCFVWFFVGCVGDYVIVDCLNVGEE